MKGFPIRESCSNGAYRPLANELPIHPLSESTYKFCSDIVVTILFDRFCLIRGVIGAQDMLEYDNAPRG